MASASTERLSEELRQFANRARAVYLNAMGRARAPGPRAVSTTAAAARAGKATRLIIGTPMDFPPLLRQAFNRSKTIHVTPTARVAATTTSTSHRSDARRSSVDHGGDSVQRRPPRCLVELREQDTYRAQMMSGLRPTRASWQLRLCSEMANS